MICIHCDRRAVPHAMSYCTAAPSLQRGCTAANFGNPSFCCCWWYISKCPKNNLHHRNHAKKTSIPTLGKLGQKYHHDWMYARKWPSTVYVLSGMWSTLRGVPHSFYLFLTGKFFGFCFMYFIQHCFICSYQIPQCRRMLVSNPGLWYWKSGTLTTRLYIDLRFQGV
jgi:hypothetical protein